ncbi:hypothetical protein A2767_04390 [Candidatus Roizmanbacteria bacterium RIFCSPHIGHO2_01_FULL_35_10]|uniref:Transposase IS200-like domain-containing protein n=1 Tax=Candidatus Roizmanbacteria bacterium RIFCSPLOWO2_01_FULL_35_13 TaxID=1802055 RepID=A0A1F7I8H2_9BACT|nr:MAG: hypothetical protein A2767_04390 [Candidatus Roizmanbacteria bacterium RIFCSPHIGHO2_01_FULL_35_10]OGK39667.1 MAG: hypothetical protein A3A74_07835 [Candidatus Roizmanbacteria bacterium RIFCSPLOWO2_01_FULL_35_13]
MPGRLEPFINNYTYHVFNKTLNSQRIFDDYNCETFLTAVGYYRSSKARVSLSHFKRMPPNFQQELLNITSQSKFFRIEILAYCLMPTHYHFLLRQKQTSGIPKFMADLGNSFTKYHNIKNGKNGPLFIPRFKAERVVTEAQLKHVCRYIYLNPYSGKLVPYIAELENYKWSSFKEYLYKDKLFLSNPELVMKLFGNDPVRFKKFVFDQADYQKSFEYIKYAEKWLR